MLQPPPITAFCNFPACYSCVNTTQLERGGDAVDSQHVGGNAIVDVVFLAVMDHVIERCDLDVLESFVHHAFGPEISLPVLHPFKVGDGDAAGVHQNVRHDEYAAVEQNMIGGRSGGAIGALDENARPKAASVAAGDDIFGGRGKQDITILLEDFLATDGFGVGEALDGL